MNKNVGAMIISLVEGLLLLRLVALLFAARPDNMWIALVLAATTPLTAPLSGLDRWVGQPRFGARLELATLAVMLLLALGTAAWQWLRQRATTQNTPLR